MTDGIIERLDRLERIMLLQCKKVLTAAEVGLLLGISESRVRHLASERKLPFYKKGTRTYFDRSEIEDWALWDRVLTDEQLHIKVLERELEKRTGRAKA